MPRTKKSNSRNNNASMKVKAPGSRKSIDQMKYEIANEFGVNLGATASSRDNGLVGGEMTKRLIENGMKKSNNSGSSNSKKKARKNNKKK